MQKLVLTDKDRNYHLQNPILSAYLNYFIKVKEGLNGAEPKPRPAEGGPSGQTDIPWLESRVIVNPLTSLSIITPPPLGVKTPMSFLTADLLLAALAELSLAEYPEPISSAVTLPPSG